MLTTDSGKRNVGGWWLACLLAILVWIAQGVVLQYVWNLLVAPGMDVAEMTLGAALGLSLVIGLFGRDVKTDTASQAAIGTMKVALGLFLTAGLAWAVSSIMAFLR